MNRFSLCLLPLLLLTAGCFSSVDDEDYKAFTKDKWREMIKDNENRLKPEEQRPIQGLENPLRLMFLIFLLKRESCLSPTRIIAARGLFICRISRRGVAIRMPSNT